ncbi:hypothetical protein [Bacteroides bouchesdurhonensis]|uniref:hypothetical protein n=1 Tax=Bacteroides bouchesdurhonensis TaxID=1841855 RepID=UPI00097F9B9C|nr:hypothetical protein [Bacteroides bouchesdurhonensis]
MNRLYLAMFFACIVSHCFSQSRDSDQLKDMINISAEKYILSELEWIKEKNIPKERYGDQFLFERTNLPTDFKFNDSIVRKYNVGILDNVAKFGRKKLKEGILMFEFHPICINRNEIFIGISSITLIKIGRDLSISRSPEGDFVIYRFCYSCEKQEWKLVGIRPSYSENFILVE